MTNNECAHNLACVNERCINPCPGSCGQNAECTVINHNPVCTCYTGYEGDPLVVCHPALPPRKIFFLFHMLSIRYWYCSKRRR